MDDPRAVHLPAEGLHHEPRRRRSEGNAHPPDIGETQGDADDEGDQANPEDASRRLRAPTPLIARIHTCLVFGPRLIEVFQLALDPEDFDVPLDLFRPLLDAFQKPRVGRRLILNDLKMSVAVIARQEADTLRHGKGGSAAWQHN